MIMRMYIYFPQNNSRFEAYFLQVSGYFIYYIIYELFYLYDFLIASNIVRVCLSQSRHQLDKWERHIYIFVFCTSNRFRKKLIVQNMNTWTCLPHLISSWRRHWPQSINLPTWRPLGGLKFEMKWNTNVPQTSDYKLPSEHKSPPVYQPLNCY